MSSQLVRELPVERTRESVGVRVRFISALGPLTMLAGVVWALIQPDRLTLLHPRGQGFWWLAIEPPLLVCFAGLVFAILVARPLVADLKEGDDGTAG